MKKLIFPTAAMMRNSDGDYKSIVSALLKIAPNEEA